MALVFHWLVEKLFDLRIVRSLKIGVRIVRIALPIYQHDHSVGGCVNAVHIVRDDNGGRVIFLLNCDNQVTYLAGRYGV